MKIAAVKSLAKQWVKQNISSSADFVGAYLTGSTIWKLDDEQHAPSSDVDIFVVMQNDKLPEKIGKINFHNVTLEINFISFADISDPQAILADYHVANAFYKQSILLDPLAQLAPLHQAVSAQFTQSQWVIKRCQNAKENARSFLKAFEQATELHDQVTTLFFAAGVTAHILLVAGHRNPTIRRRYVESKFLLHQHGFDDIHQTLLTTLGSHNMDKPTVIRHLSKLDAHFTTACRVMKSPYMFAADMKVDLTSIAIGGSAEMIEASHHKEAIFWLIAIYGRCRTVIYADGTQAQLTAIDADLWGLLNELGIHNLQDMRLRAQMVEQDIETVWAVAQKII